jgi:hypothetical protein
MDFKTFDSCDLLEFINELAIMDLYTKQYPSMENSHFILLDDYYIVFNETTKQNNLVLIMELAQCNLKEIIDFRKKIDTFWTDS